ncbi:S8 family serine peptidase [Glycomyces sp. NPDC047010]|uniref:S8 family serine peptidase n=1 Tax=Glycomyces sp. NPDC047010 TaxID=3155023 RepID=UPI0033D93759
MTDLIQAPGAWGTTEGEGVTVAVVDTGISEHPFFEDKDVLPGYTVFPDEEDAWNDNDGHGTAVASAVLLAAPKATLMPVRIDTGAALEVGGAIGEPEYEAFRWAVDNGADVLVMPWGLIGQSYPEEYAEVLQYVIDKGAIVVASTGNTPEDPVFYPASTEGVVAVTGTERDGEIWYENTTTGPEVVVAAPADEMTIPLPSVGSLSDDQDLYGPQYGGTSMGSGFVGGVAALTWAAHPELDASNVIQRIIQTAGDGNGERSEDAGYGLVNADQAVNAEGIEPVQENPLGYPMGEPGASGATPDDPAPSDSAQDPGAATGGPSAAAEGNKESNLSTIIVVAAAVVLVGAAIAVWLVLRGRGRKAAAQQQGQFNPGNGPGQAPYQQGAQQQPYVPPGGGGQNYGGPPPGQGYSSPPQGYGQPNPGEQSPPWRPSEPNQR